MVEFTDISDILFADYGFQVLHGALDGGLEMPVEQVRALEAELKKKECSLMQYPGSGLERVVFVLAVKIIDENDYILMQLGVFTDKNALKPDAKLPAVKRMSNEAPHEALDRLMASKLAALEDLVNWGDREHNTQVEESATYGIRTRYIRTVQLATWKGIDHQQPSGLVAVPRRSVASNRSSFRLPANSRLSTRSMQSNVPAIAIEIEHAGCQNSFLLNTDDGDMRLYGWVSPSLHDSLKNSWRRKEILQGIIDRLDKSCFPAAENHLDLPIRQASGESGCSDITGRQASGSLRGDASPSSGTPTSPTYSSHRAGHQQEQTLTAQQDSNFQWLHV